MTPDDERINYLQDEGSALLSESDRASLDELRALLADSATWAQPDPGLEDRVVAAIAQQAASEAFGTAQPPAASPRASRRPALGDRASAGLSTRLRQLLWQPSSRS